MRVNRGHRPCILSVFCIALAALVLVLAAHIPASQALSPGKVSLSAEMTAGMRAVAAMDPDEKIRNPDYLAEKFLKPNFWLFSIFRKDYHKSKEFIKYYRFSAYYTANALTWHTDSVLQKLAAKNLKQVVCIGAGLGSHAYRFGKQMPGVRFFEVDQPATQDYKKEMVKSVFGELPANVTYIPADYRTKPIFDTLRQAGYDEAQKTLFIWESIRYSDKKAVDSTMRSIAQHSAPGSEVVFNYISDDVVQGDYGKHPGARFAAVRMSTSGEPWKFGIAEGQAHEFVTQRGLKVISDLGAKELSEKYLVRSDGTTDGGPTAYVRVMHAAVNR